MTREIFAAGTICWRRVNDAHGTPQILVLLIHRTKQRDVSFPKGKLDAGESMPEAAVRETREETGLNVRLGMHLGTIHYDLPNRAAKTVQYWAAEVTPKAALASSFSPNSEVAALEWVPVAAARKRLTYKADRELYDVFLRLHAHDLLETFTVTLLRHAKAEPRSSTYPIDSARPLQPSGERHAHTLAPILASFGPKRLYTSPAVRCRDTITPLALQCKRRVRERDALSQDTWETGDLSGLRALVTKVITRSRNVVLCTHRPVLPDLVRELSLATGSLPGSYLTAAADLPPGGFSIFHFSRSRPGAGVLAVETYPLSV